MRNPKRQPDDPAQSKRFIETAREVEADETKEGFNRAFEKVVPPGSSQSKARARRKSGHSGGSA